MSAPDYANCQPKDSSCAKGDVHTCRKLFRSFVYGLILRHGSQTSKQQVYRMSVDFKGAHYPKSVILYAVYFYVRYGVSYRDL